MRIIYKTLENTVTVIVPSSSWGGTMEELARKDVPSGLEYKIVEDSAIPTDWSLRNSWEVDADFKISENLNKSKEITKERLRVERKPLLEKQDVLFMKAQEDGTSTTAIVTEKKRLRDITKSVDSCTTTDALKALNCTE